MKLAKLSGRFSTTHEIRSSVTPWNAPARRSIVAFRLVPLRSFARHSLVINHFSLLHLLAPRISTPLGVKRRQYGRELRRYINLYLRLYLLSYRLAWVRAKVCNLTARSLLTNGRETYPHHSRIFYLFVAVNPSEINSRFQVSSIIVWID